MLIFVNFESITRQKRRGESVQKPSLEDLKAALNELKVKDDEHPDTWLENDRGDVLVADQDGKIKYYNFDTPNAVKEKKLNSVDEILEVWL